MDSLHNLLQQGKVLYLGISDAPAYIVATANTYAKAHGKTQFSIYQGRWNVMSRDMERDIVPMCRHFGTSKEFYRNGKMLKYATNTMKRHGRTHDGFLRHSAPQS